MEIQALTLDQKFARALFKLRDIRPFFSAVYESIPHIDTDSIDTMAVNGKEFLYNPKFAESLEFPEFLFVILHEVGHIALMHVPRRQERNSLLWNVACDLYVNGVLAAEFEIKPDELSKDKNVKFPKSALFCSSIDLENDTTEWIYDRLAEQAVLNGFFEKDFGKFKFTVTGTARCAYDKYHVFETTIDKETFYYGDLSGDLMDSGDDKDAVAGANKRIIAEARVKHDMMYGNAAGSGSGILGQLVANILDSYIDWRKLLRKYCIDITSKDSSFHTPDKRMYYQRAIYPGNRGENEKTIERVKICFDRSGSISDQDTQYFYGQARALLKEFKIEAELINWDTEVLGTSTMSKPEFIKKANIIHGGGTDPSCVFRYFDSKDCKIKPLVTVIFTDGYICWDGRPHWKKKYKNTIWVMTRNYNKNFEPEFGKLTVAKFNK